MPSRPFLSVVLPVRNGDTWIISEVKRLQRTLLDWKTDPFELIVVDDGSRDRTLERLGELRERIAQLRVVRHSQSRGIEAAGQTGLETSLGEVILIQESSAPVRLEDMRQLLEMSRDPSVVIARAESASRPLSGPLLRRLRAGGAAAPALAGNRLQTRHDAGLQMIRRKQWRELLRPSGRKTSLRSSRYLTTTLAAAPLTPSPPSVQVAPPTIS